MEVQIHTEITKIKAMKGGDIKEAPKNLVRDQEAEPVITITKETETSLVGIASLKATIRDLTIETINKTGIQILTKIPPAQYLIERVEILKIIEKEGHMSGGNTDLPHLAEIILADIPARTITEDM